ncbi:MAG: Prepilin-type cleavage/methylation domain containing protein [Parcubacteria group bacterium GW2011_GWC1_43_11b]|uniref:Type II secretion system protein J n=1 Tax=Candidatus Vogelbacteria bacterium RIFOXYB1_FULL_42_16 TaxID=1802436 RepID=A0A1G2QE70_9BACT|nr:MAG: Prepilin-type cleavage/methylation domain containing protein [Parcubacteria group bacterium GW2011_GWB1_42_9]KKS89432.1 MAG: Prepilin-type cleavage/methylation domain containing protein [Parcubacteria group bacterium GW2011_GWC1_43_11b]KKT10019.1 MAG: Prepilin-type cleavage/methylation domain containing protein [Parcubacteria group bacterium GW2011_GWA1_43_21]OHA58359.1 MAG: hypothetical protein A2370_01440 [Candidatus Vogelbacteria bacterium RIFOXYB1_FULL_42_16]
MIRKKNNIVKNCSATRSSGFTLVEMIVAVGIFLIVAFTITGTFVVALDAYRKAQQVNQITENINYVLNRLAINVREGTDIQINNDVLSLKIGAIDYFYRLSDGAIEESVGDQNNYKKLTSDKVKIMSLEFEQQSVQTERPAVKVDLLTIRIHSQVAFRQTTTDIDIQTTVFPRQLIVTK